MKGTARTRWGTVLTFPPAAGRPNDWLRFWRLREDEVVFHEDGRVELPLQGYVRLRLHPVWAPDVSGMAGLLGLRTEDVMEEGDGWVLAPVPNAAMAVREGRVILWCVSFVPRLDELEEMVLGTRYRQLHRFLEETERYRRRVGYSLTEEGELLYGGAVGGKVPLYHRVVLPTRLLRPEEVLLPTAAEGPAPGWVLPGPVAEGAAAGVIEGQEGAAPEGASSTLPEAEDASRPQGEADPQEATLAQPAAGPAERLPEEAVLWPEAGPEREARGRAPLLERAAGAIVRAAVSLAMRPAGEEPEEAQELTDYLQVTGGVRTLVWALRQEGAPARGAPAVWARGQSAGVVVELSRELGEREALAAIARAGKRLGLGPMRARRVAPRLWQLSPPALPDPLPEAAAVGVVLVPVGRRQEAEGAVWVVLADLSSPGGLLLETTPADEERWLGWWTAAVSLSLPGLEVWAQEGTWAARTAARRFPTAAAGVDALYDEVVGRFEEEGGRRQPLLAVVRLPDERDREMLVTLAARGAEVGCYVVALGEAAGGRFPAWVRALGGEVEACVAGGRAQLLPPEVEAPAAAGEAPSPEAPAAVGAQEAEGRPSLAPGETAAEEGAAGHSGRSEVPPGGADTAAVAAAQPQPGGEAFALEARTTAAEAGPEEVWEEEGEAEEGAQEEPLEGARVQVGPPPEAARQPPVGRPLEVMVLGPYWTSLHLDRQVGRELLALLVLRGGEIGREEAAALLEGQQDTEVGVAYALNKLRHAVKALRRACDDAGLPKGVFQLLRSGRVVVTREWVHCDLWEAMDLATALAMGTGGPRDVERLAGLIRGSILEGEVFRWAEQEVERVGRRLRGLLLRAARQLAADGWHMEAAGLAGAARRLDPLDEVALRAELTSLLAQGKAAQARQAYHSFLREMRRLLGEEVAPEEETLAIARLLEETE